MRRPKVPPPPPPPPPPAAPPPPPAPVARRPITAAKAPSRTLSGGLSGMLGSFGGARASGTKRTQTKRTLGSGGKLY